MSAKVLPGIDVLRDNGFAAFREKRVGLLSNPSGVDSQLRSTQQIFQHAPEVDLVALFAPEHGVAASAQDGEPVREARDPGSGLPIHSLYGDHFRPTPEMLAGVDVVVCDIQDIGVRFYTFAWTVSQVLEAAGEQGVEVMILDRPNPLGGLHMDGPLLQNGLQSLVGRGPVPVQHGLTLGELMGMFNALWNPHPCELSVVACAGWQRSMRWAETGLNWVPPSPNMPQLETLLHYPGACLIEGANCSEGRGTALPFEIVGAPWIDAAALADALNRQNWPGVIFRPHVFVPSASKYQGETCFGVQAHRIDTEQYRPLESWLAVIQTIRRCYPVDFVWLPPVNDRYHFDRLIGNYDVRAQIEDEVPVAEIVQSWQDDLRRFDEQRRPYMRY